MCQLDEFRKTQREFLRRKKAEPTPDERERLREHADPGKPG
jgi:hypothetical protein